jgi:hypothetical protein
MESSNNQTENLIAVPVQAESQFQMQQQIQPQPIVQQQQPSTSFTIFFFKFFSVISWVMLIVTSLEAYFQNSLFYIFYRTYRSKSIDVQFIGISKLYLPITIDTSMLQSFFLIILFFGFFNFAYYGLYKGDNSLIDPLFTNITKYHFVPLLLVSFINMNMQINNEMEEMEGEIITDLVFTFIALGLLGYIYIKTNLEHKNWFFILTIKKGLFSFLIVILWYNLFYASLLIGCLNCEEEILKFLKGAGIAFSILIGFGAMLFSFIFKDLIAAVTNLLIYIGMVSSFFGINGKDELQREFSGGVADGVIEIVMMVLNLGLIVLLISKFSNYLNENKYSS